MNVPTPWASTPGTTSCGSGPTTTSPRRTINLFEGGSPAQLTNGGFGAAWSHEDRFYFASNSGAGVYEVLVDTIDLNARTATIRRVANSQATAINDGTTCVGIDVVEPEVVEVGSFDCAAYPALIQIIGKANSGMEVKQLDIASGEYTEIYSIPFDRTPPFTGLNAVGINPVDSIIYGLMKLSTDAAYLAVSYTHLTLPTICSV